MSCERYWREGIVLVEHGLADEHRDGCEDCTRAHASRQELIDALPLIGAGAAGDPYWQSKVWQRLGEQRAGAPRRWYWQLTGALAIACVVALWIRLDHKQPGAGRTGIEIVERGAPMRSRSAHVDDLLRVTAGESSDVWIYRADHLVLACRTRTTSAGCAPGAHGMVVELPLSVPGTYEVFVVEVPGALVPHSVLDEARAMLESAGLPYEAHQVQVR
jgi:hypothetical protein